MSKTGDFFACKNMIFDYSGSLPNIAQTRTATIINPAPVNAIQKDGGVITIILSNCSGEDNFSNDVFSK